MKKLLHVVSSPRKERSHSIEMAEVFIKACMENHPECEIETLDLWDCVLPDFDEKTINAKYKILHGLEHDEIEATFWQRIKDIFEVFNSADRYLFSVPMWNFSIPYKLKHFIDLIVQPTLCFNFSQKGYEGLVKDRSAFVIYSSGASYDDKTMEHVDFQKKYFEYILNFVGISDLKTVSIAPTLAPQEDLKKMKLQLSDKLKKAASAF